MSRSMSSASVVHEMWPDGGDLVRPNVGSGLVWRQTMPSWLDTHLMTMQHGDGGVSSRPGGNI